MDIQTLVKISETLIKHYPNVEVSMVLNSSWIVGKNTIYIKTKKQDTLWLMSFDSVTAFYRAITQEVRGKYISLDTVGLIGFSSTYYLDKQEEVAIKSFSKDTAILTDDRKVELNRLWIKE